jgi:membrane protease YdiL (CAAX protease family)
LRHSLTETGWALALLILAAFFEELLYRGYAFQTLLRGTHPVLPVSLLSVLFGLSHLGNPNSTPFSTANTILAGIWLSLAYLRSGNLWFPAGLHLGWNVVLGPVLGLPVSGRLIPAHPLLLSSSIEPGWLTGGGYGSEGGAAATVVLLVAIFGLADGLDRSRRRHNPRPPTIRLPSPEGEPSGYLARRIRPAERAARFQV